LAAALAPPPTAYSRPRGRPLDVIDIGMPVANDLI
jgi:hypothetical protein